MSKIFNGDIGEQPTEYEVEPLPEYGVPEPEYVPAEEPDRELVPA